MIYVAGVNGNTGSLSASPKAAIVGQDNLVRASLYVPNGTLWLKGGTQARGACLARDVLVGDNMQIWLESAFGE